MTASAATGNSRGNQRASKAAIAAEQMACRAVSTRWKVARIHMIVNSIATGWEIFYHRGHALLAAEIASQWRSDERPARWLDTLAAISQHDDLERELQGDHLTQAGAPMDFTQQRTTSVAALRGMVTDALYRSRWVALLTSMHLCFLSEPQRGVQAELDAFLDDQYAQQGTWRRALKVRKAEAEAAYAFMQWCDRLSLILCQRGLPVGGRTLEVSNGPDNRRYNVLQRADESVEVRPWPFAPERFAVHAEARYLKQLQFACTGDLVAALQEAPIKTIEWTLAR